jgi:hypothetical protein
MNTSEAQAAQDKATMNGRPANVWLILVTSKLPTISSGR